MASDTFDGSGALGASWGDCSATWVASKFERVSGIAQTTATFDTAGARYTSSTEDVSQIIIKAFTTGTAVTQKGLVLRCNGTTGYYGFMAIDAAGYAEYMIYKVSPDGTWLASSSSNLPTNNEDHTMRFTASGTSTVTLTIYMDEISRLTVDDSTSPITSGNPGFFMTANSSLDVTHFDDWTDGAGGEPPAGMSQARLRSGS